MHDVILKAAIPEEAPKLQTRVTLDADFDLGPHRFHAVAKFPGEFEFTAKLSNFALEHFLESMASASDLLETIPAFWFREADLVFNPATVAFQFHGRVDQDWTLPIGVRGLELTEIEVILSREAGRPMTAPLQGELRGVLTLADMRVPVSHALGEAVSAFAGDVSRLDAGRLIQQLCDVSAGRRIPFLYQQLLGDTQITISVEQRAIYLKSEPTGKFGPSEWLIEKRRGIWGYSLSPKLPQDWKLSRLAPFLFELNRLTLTDPRIAISMFDDRADLFPEWPDDAADHLGEGINVVANVALSSLPELETLAKACRLSGEVRMLGMLADRPDGRELALEAPLARFRLGDVGEMLEPVLRLQHRTDRPYEVTVHGQIQFELTEGEPQRFDGHATITATQVALVAELDQPWPQPFGVRGAAIDRLLLSVTAIPATGEMNFHLVGRAHLGAAQGSARIFQSKGVSSYQLRLAFDHLSPSVILAELAPPGVKLPVEARAVLERGFSDVRITATQGATVLQGQLELMGRLGEFVGGFGQDSGLRGFGSLAPLRWMRVAGGRHVFELTRGQPEAFSKIDPDAAGAFPGGEVGPLLRLALGTESPGVQLSASATLFTEFTCPVFAETTRKGAAFPYHFENGQIELKLQCQIDETGFAATGDVTMSIETRLDLVEPKSGINLATLPFKAKLIAKLSLSIGQAFEATLIGDLTWRGHRLPVAKIVLTDTPTTFSDLKGSVLAVLRERGFAMLFKSELGKTASFFGAVREGWIQTGRSLNLSASQLTLALRNALAPPPQELTVILHELGYNAAEITAALSEQVRLSADAAAKPLEQSGVTANEIAEALYIVYGSGADACATALRGAGFDHMQTGAALHLSCDAPPAQLTKAMKGAGYSADEITHVLRLVTPTPLDLAYRVLNNAGFKALEAMQALRGICDTDREETEQLLTQAGWSPREVRSTIDKSFETLGGLFN